MIKRFFIFFLLLPNDFHKENYVLIEKFYRVLIYVCWMITVKTEVSPMFVIQ